VQVIASERHGLLKHIAENANKGAYSAGSNFQLASGAELAMPFAGGRNKQVKGTLWKIDRPLLEIPEARK
jgi:hypothetical protein